MVRGELLSVLLGAILIVLLPTALCQQPSFFYPYGPDVGDDNLTNTGTGSGVTDAYVLSLGYNFRWFSGVNYNQLKISKHGQVSFDPSWTPTLSPGIDLTIRTNPPLIAALADNFPTFEKGEVHFRVSTSGEDITRANYDLHNVSRALLPFTIDSVIVVTWDDIGPDADLKGNTFQLVMLQTPTRETYIFMHYSSVSVATGMKGGFRDGGNLYKFESLAGLTVQSNIGEAGIWFYRTFSNEADIPPPVDAIWWAWSIWGPCSVTCDGGLQNRSRTCNSDHADHGGSNTCVGYTDDMQMCNTNNCTDPWNDWGDWTECTVTCGGGLQERHRTCNGTRCVGWFVDFIHCNEVDCPLDGVWSEWQVWSDCSATCGLGSHTRIRSCDGLRAGGDTCQGSDVEHEACAAIIVNCPVHGGWSVWGTWSACSATCGGGIKSRYRTCTAPSPLYAGNSCPGWAEEHETCSEQLCEVSIVVDGVWTPWNPGSCSVTCGTGITTRTRTCANPAQHNGGLPCPGPANDVTSCTNTACPVDGIWGWWNEWRPCTYSCGEDGKHYRFRYCDDPSPEYGGTSCGVSPDTTVTKDLLSKEGFTQFQEGECNRFTCDSVDGKWGEWSQTGSCSVTCGGGRKQMRRFCERPAPKYGGQACAGGEDPRYDLELFSCNNKPCPRHGFWRDWSEWSECSVTCSEGIQTRIRECQKAEFNGYDCFGDTSEDRACYNEICHINGSWSDWTAWSECSVSCGGGLTTRTRACDNPTPNGNGTDCEGEVEEEQVCMTQTCPPVDGGWSGWGPWTTCSALCNGKGIRTRSRHCINPRPQRGGRDCEGDDDVRAKLCTGESCNQVVHYRDGAWGSWTSWSPCPVTCGGGKTRRTATCDSPSPLGGGSNCNLTFPVSIKYLIKKDQFMLCAINPCPVDGNWGSWSSWASCSASCGTSLRGKMRRCDNPPPSNDGQTCQDGKHSTNKEEIFEPCTVEACPEGEVVDPTHYAPGFNPSEPSCSFVQVSGGYFWPHTNAGKTVAKPCPRPTIGNMTRTCIRSNSWGNEDRSLCTSASFKDLNYLDVAALQQDPVQLEYMVGQFVNTCRADQMEVQSDLTTCCERFRLLVDVGVLLTEALTEEENVILYEAILTGGNELFAKRNKPLWDIIVNSEAYSETSLVVETTKQFEQLAEQMAQYLLTNGYPTYRKVLGNVDLNIDPVECYIKTYTYPESTSATRVSVPATTLTCTPGLESSQGSSGSQGSQQGSEESSEAPVTVGASLPVQNSVSPVDTTITVDITDMLTTGAAPVGRRRRQTGGNPVYYVLTLHHVTLNHFLPAESRVAYNTPQPYKDPRTGHSDYVYLMAVGADPIYTQVLAGHVIHDNLIINFTHTLDGDDPECGYIKQIQGQSLYSSEGCTVNKASVTYTVCECPGDAGTFVLLLNPADNTLYQIPTNPIFLTALILGIIVHAVILILYLVLWLVRLDRHFMAVNFVAAFTTAQLVALLSILAVNNDAACRGLAWLVHFLLLAAMFWVLCIAGYSFTEVRSTKPIGWCRRLAYVLVGWGLPAFVSIITAALYQENLDRTFFCWYPYYKSIFIAYGLPLGITALMTIVILIVAFVRNSPGRHNSEDMLALHGSDRRERHIERKRYLIIMLVLLEVIVLNFIMFGIVIPVAFLISNIIQAIFDVVLFLIVDVDALERMLTCCNGKPEDESPPSTARSTPAPTYTPPRTPLFVQRKGTPMQEEINKDGVQVLNAEAIQEEARNTPVPPVPDIVAPTPTSDVQDDAEVVVLAEGDKGKKPDKKKKPKEKKPKEETKKKEKEKKEKKPKEEKEKKEKEKKPKEEKEKKQKEEKEKKEKKKKKKVDKEEPVVPVEAAVAVTGTAATAAAVVQLEDVESPPETSEQEAEPQVEQPEPEPEVPEPEEPQQEEPQDQPEQDEPEEQGKSEEQLLQEEIEEMENEELQETEEEKEPEKEEEKPQEEEEKAETPKPETPKPPEEPVVEPKPTRGKSSISRGKSGVSRVLQVQEDTAEERPTSAPKVVTIKHS